MQPSEEKVDLVVLHVAPSSPPSIYTSLDRGESSKESLGIVKENMTLLQTSLNKEKHQAILIGNVME
jgi:hypothetical protein